MKRLSFWEGLALAALLFFGGVVVYLMITMTGK